MSEHVIAIHTFLARYLWFHDRFQRWHPIVYLHMASHQKHLSKRAVPNIKETYYNRQQKTSLTSINLGKKTMLRGKMELLGDSLSLSFWGVFSRSNDLVKQLSSLKILPGSQGQFMNDDIPQYIDQYKEQKKPQALNYAHLFLFLSPYSSTVHN